MITALKGMKDRYSDDVKKYDAIVDASKKVFGKYGFERIITPILEETELFRRGVGDETDVVSKEMYDFKDKGERDVYLLFKKFSHVTFGPREDRVQVSHVLDSDSDCTDIPDSKRTQVFHTDSELGDSFFVGN